MSLVSVNSSALPFSCFLFSILNFNLSLTLNPDEEGLISLIISCSGLMGIIASTFVFLADSNSGAGDGDGTRGGRGGLGPLIVVELITLVVTSKGFDIGEFDLDGFLGGVESLEGF